MCQLYGEKTQISTLQTSVGDAFHAFMSDREQSAIAQGLGTTLHEVIPERVFTERILGDAEIPG